MKLDMSDTWAKRLLSYVADFEYLHELC